MAPALSRALVAAVAATALFRSAVFVPAPSGRAAPLPAVASAAASLGAAGAAHADAIGDAAAKLSKAAYPFMKEVPWNSNLYNIKPGSADAVSWAKAVGKMIAMGAQMDPALLKAGAKAHHDAIQVGGQQAYADTDPGQGPGSVYTPSWPRQEGAYTDPGPPGGAWPGSVSVYVCCPPIPVWCPPVPVLLCHAGTSDPERAARSR